MTDDGRGFDPSQVSYGTGLQGISDRLAALDGTVEVESVPGRGTTVTGRLPGPSHVEAAWLRVEPLPGPPRP